MRLYTIEKNGRAQVAAEIKGSLYPLEALGIHVQDMNALILGWDEVSASLQEKIREVEAGQADVQPTEDYTLLAPIVKPLQDVICLGVNYREHIEEAMALHDFSQKKDAIYFSKRVHRCSATGETIPNYDFVDRLDYEAELGVILKRDAKDVKVGEVKDYLFGYTIINDVSARNLQVKHQQWYRGKSLDGYTPMGPCIVTADALDAHNLNITCDVNGERRQESNTRYMITTVEEAVAELSQGMTLEAGTVITTGTPGGVALGMKPPVFLKSGDVIRCEIESIGVLENTVGCPKAEKRG